MEGAPEAGALVVLDFETATEQRAAVDALRSAGFAGPVVILGGESPRSPDDEPIARPVRLGTLLARIDAHASRPEGAETYRLGPYEFAASEGVLRRRGDGVLVRLTELERKLIVCLAEAGGAIVAREQLLSQVWGYSADVATHTVETHIWRLRQKIETEDVSTALLLTEAGGYRLASADDLSEG